MKKLIILFAVVSLAGSTTAQWNLNGLNVYYNNGNVGVGTDAPSNTQGWDKLIDVRGSSNAKIISTTNGGSVRVGIYAHDVWMPGGGGHIGTESNHPVYFIAGYSPKMMLTTDGRLGIGLTNSYSHSRLHVKAATSSPWNILAEASSNGRIIGLAHNGNEGLISTSTLDTNPGFGHSPLSLQTSNIRRLTIDVNGLVGINQSAPTARFNVQQSGATWSDGIRLSLDGRNWDIVSDTNGERLVISKDQNWANSFVIKDGNVGIGSNLPDKKLTVNGTIHGKEVLVDLNVPGPDYVFEKDYDLPTLEEVQSYIDENKRLPEVPSAKEMEANGINVAEMNMILLKKVEELTLYLIEQQKQVNEQKKEIELLKKQK